MKSYPSILIGLIALALVVAACGAATAPVTPASTPTAALDNTLVNQLAAVTKSGNFHDPLDSTPTMDATTIYFTATGPHGPGVFRVPAAGGAATEVFTGKPFVTPRGISISADDQHLYIADPSAGAGGELFVLGTNGGSPVPVHGSVRTAPQNLDIATRDGKQMLYFSGRDPRNGEAALLELPTAGADAPTVLVEGRPLVAPDGVVVADTGSIYLADRAAAGGGLGSVMKIDGSKITVIVKKVRTGNPAGIALAKDQSILLVSALQLNRPSDQVFLVNLHTGQTGSITSVISQNHNGGGLHSCDHAVVQTSSASASGVPFAQLAFYSPQQEKWARYAWADLSAGGAGTVYRIDIR